MESEKLLGILSAKRVTQALVGKSLQMDDFPLTGKVVAELKDESVREVSLYSYRILYEVKPDCLEVMAVMKFCFIGFV